MHLDDLPSDLRQTIEKHAKEHPSSVDIINQIISFYSNGNSASKKRKINSGNSGNDINLDSLGKLSFVVHDLSLTTPVRRKNDLEFYENGVAIINPKTKSIDFMAEYSQIKAFLVLPTPSKTKPHTTFILDLSNENSVIFGIDDTQKIKLSKSGKQETIQKDLLVTTISEIIGKEADTPHKSIFFSAFSQPSKKNYIYSINGYHKASDIYLYLLKSGIFVGFKKPTCFIPLKELKNYHVSSVTFRTFNLTIETLTNSFEISMIDSSEYERIMEYMHDRHKSWNPIVENVKPQNEDEKDNVIELVSEEEDEDFGEEHFSNESELEEEYDSNYDTNSEQSDQEDDDDSEGGESQAEVEEDETNQPSKNPSNAHLVRKDSAEISPKVTHPQIQQDEIDQEDVDELSDVDF